MTAKSHIKSKPGATKVAPPASTASEDDGMEIPEFLRISAEDRKAGWANWVPPPGWDKPTHDYASINAKFKEAELAQAEARLAKRRAQTQRKVWQARADADPNASWKRRSGLSQADYTRIRNELYAAGGCTFRYLAIFDRHARQDPRTKRWQLVGLSKPVPATTPAPTYSYNGKTKTPAQKPAASASASDDTAVRLLAYNRDQLLALAKANDLYKPVYETLPNPGLVRMTVGNRLRALVRRGQPINWV